MFVPPLCCQWLRYSVSSVKQGYVFPMVPAITEEGFVFISDIVVESFNRHLNILPVVLESSQGIMNYK